MLRRVEEILSILDAAEASSEIDLPGYCLHPLTGPLKGYWSVLVAGNWRIVYRFEDGAARDVDLVEYHHEETTMAMKAPVHPGRIVKGALDDLELSVTDAAVLNVARPTLTNLINGHAGVSPEMAVRLSKSIGSTPGFWLRLQMNYELSQIEQRADSIEVNPLPRRSS